MEQPYLYIQMKLCHLSLRQRLEKVIPQQLELVKVFRNSGTSMQRGWCTEGTSTQTTSADGIKIGDFGLVNG